MKRPTDHRGHVASKYLYIFAITALVAISQGCVQKICAGDACTHSLYVNVSGLSIPNTIDLSDLSNTSVVSNLPILTLNQEMNQIIIKNGRQRFDNQLFANGASYSVTIKQQPTKIGQSCTLVNASGKFEDSDIDTMQLNCTTP